MNTSTSSTTKKTARVLTPKHNSRNYANDSFSSTASAAAASTPKKKTLKKKVVVEMIQKAMAEVKEEIREGYNANFLAQETTILELQEEIESLKKKVIDLEASLSANQERRSPKVDPEVSANVRAAYATLEEESKWNLDKKEGFTSKHNSLVTSKLINLVKVHHQEKPDSDIRVSCNRYFNHLKRSQKDENEMTTTQYEKREKTKRLAARRTQLFKKRKKTALSLELDERQEFMLKNLSSEFMTDEDSEADDNGETIGYISHGVAWRSSEMDDFIVYLDSHVKGNGMKRRRVVGSPTKRKPTRRVNMEFVNSEFVDIEFVNNDIVNNVSVNSDNGHSS